MRLCWLHSLVPVSTVSPRGASVTQFLFFVFLRGNVHVLRHDFSEERLISARLVSGPRTVLVWRRHTPEDRGSVLELWLKACLSVSHLDRAPLS